MLKIIQWSLTGLGIIVSLRCYFRWKFVLFCEFSMKQAVLWMHVSCEFGRNRRRSATNDHFVGCPEISKFACNLLEITMCFQFFTFPGLFLFPKSWNKSCALRDSTILSWVNSLNCSYGVWVTFWRSMEIWYTSLVMWLEKQEL